MSIPPAVDVLADLVQREIEAQERLDDALDSKASTILGFAGVLVGLASTRSQSDLGIVGFGCASAAAVTAVVALVPRPMPVVAPATARIVFQAEQPDAVTLQLTNARIAIYTESEQLLQRKRLTILVAVVLLALAIVVSGLGASL
jgi:hypothetical protein